MAFQSFRYALMGQTEQAVRGPAARSIKEQMQLTDEWNVAAPMILPTAYSWLEDYPAVEREAAEALATPDSRTGQAGDDAWRAGVGMV